MISTSSVSPFVVAAPTEYGSRAASYQIAYAYDAAVTVTQPALPPVDQQRRRDLRVMRSVATSLLVFAAAVFFWTVRFAPAETWAGYVRAAQSEPGTALEVDGRGARVSDLPFS